MARRNAEKKRSARNALGPALRKVREGHGWSQADVAAKLQRIGWSVDRTLVTKIEARRRCITDYELVLLSRVLKLSLTDLTAPLKSHDLLSLTDSAELF